MKNKEAYKQAFKHVHYQKEVNLNQKRIPNYFCHFIYYITFHIYRSLCFRYRGYTK